MTRYLPVLLISVILLGGLLVSAQVTTVTISGVVEDSCWMEPISTITPTPLREGRREPT